MGYLKGNDARVADPRAPVHLSGRARPPAPVRPRPPLSRTVGGQEGAARSLLKIIQCEDGVGTGGGAGADGGADGVPEQARAKAGWRRSGEAPRLSAGCVPFIPFPEEAPDTRP